MGEMFKLALHFFVMQLLHGFVLLLKRGGFVISMGTVCTKSERLIFKGIWTEILFGHLLYARNLALKLNAHIPEMECFWVAFRDLSNEK